MFPPSRVGLTVTCALAALLFGHLPAESSVYVYSRHVLTGGQPAVIQGHAAALDSAGQLYVAGFVRRNSTPGVPFHHDVVVYRIGADGQAADGWFIGGLGDDQARAIAVDVHGDVYVAGSTTSADFPVKDALRSTYGGNTDGFLLKLKWGVGVVY